MSRGAISFGEDQLDEIAAASQRLPSQDRARFVSSVHGRLLELPIRPTNPEVSEAIQFALGDYRGDNVTRLLVQKNTRASTFSQANKRK